MELDWVSALSARDCKEHPDGLPESNAELVRLIASWFIEQNGDEPAESSLKEHAGLVLKEIDNVRRESAR